MEDIRSDVIGGFNSFVKAQRAEEGECLMTLVQFDSQDPYEVICEATPLAELTDLTEANFSPRASTPLYDAMGHAIANAAIRQEKLAAKGRPSEQVLFVTLTDGLENASSEYSREKVFKAINKRQKDGWTFAYLGANQDAFAEGGAIGVAAGATRGYVADAPGTAMAFQALASSTSRFRRRGAAPANEDFFAEEPATGEDNS
jgi:hypothetical protein